MFDINLRNRINGNLRKCAADLDLLTSSNVDEICEEVEKIRLQIADEYLSQQDRSRVLQVVDDAIEALRNGEPVQEPQKKILDLVEWYQNYYAPY